MADFLDAEAEESSESELETSRGGKGNKRNARAMEESSEEEEDDDEARLREEMKDLIDDGSSEESGRDSDNDENVASRKKRKKSRSADYDDRLEDDDYDLIEENLGITVQRKKRFKRLRHPREVDSDEEDRQGSGEEREAIANEIFDSSGDENGRKSTPVEGVQEQTFREEVQSDDDASEVDDFIVDDEGRPVAEKRRKKRTHAGDAALQEAQDIFGIDFDYEEFGKYGEEAEGEDDDDENDEDGEDEGGRETRRRPKKTREKRGAGRTVFEVYEPSELRRGHFTDVDNEVRNADMPERMQLRSIPVTPVPEGSDELKEEAEWIYKYAFRRASVSVQDADLSEDVKMQARDGPTTVGKIGKALEFMRNQNFEVPFVSFYRKEYVNPELNMNDLWRVYKWDAKWCELRERKAKLASLVERMRNHQLDELTKRADATLPEDVRPIRDEEVERVRSIETCEELNDVHRHFGLYYGNELDALQAGTPRGEEVPKQATRSGSYALCRKARLDGFTKRFGLTPEEYGENLRDNYQRHEIDQESMEPRALAQNYRSRKLGTVDEVVRAATHMVAIQLAREPLVRKCVREMYRERAKITIRPTKKGAKEIDENHPVYSLKYLKAKPVTKLVGDEYLKLAIAERDKLVTIEFSENIEGATSDDYLNEMRQLYHRDEFSKTVQAWNALRAEAIETAYRRMLLPDFKKELQSVLMAEAKEFVLRACARKMYNWIKVAPYAYDPGRGSAEAEQWEEEEEEAAGAKPADEDDDTWSTSKGLRVMGLAYVPDFSQAAFACLVSPEGECTDHLRLPNLLRRKNSPREEDRAKKEADLLAIRNFLRSRKPHVIAISGESREATMIRDDLKECVTQLVQEDRFPEIGVEVCENELAKIYANGTRGTEEFRDYPVTLRQAISIARRLQDPLVEFSQLCGPDDEILCLNYHPYQNELSKEELLEDLRLEFVNRVNEVGVDLNAALQRENRANLVQFVCGLGPRKARALLKLLRISNKRIENRMQLVTVCHMGPKIFINTAGFIKIDTASLGDGTDTYVEVLDGTRIHPETYEWARKMAVDALEYEDEEGANPAEALHEILESPDRLKDLDLDAFAVELERQGFGDKSVTLYDIRAELNTRYKDLRMPYETPSPETLFNMLTKETPESFYIGKLTTATVTSMCRRKPDTEQLDGANPVRNDTTGLWQCPFCLKNDYPELSDVWNHFDAGNCPGKATGVRLRLDNGVSGYIHVRNLSDKHVDNPEDRVHVGQVIHCRIIKIEVDRFSVQCTSRSSDLADKQNKWRPQPDLYYDAEAEKKIAGAEEEARRSKQQHSYVKRVIVHTAFHNVNYAEAAKLLEPMKQGEVIVRPSSKGIDRLTVTWKVTDQVLHHIDVREVDKSHAFSLGKRLFIGDEEFEDLDEIIARHVNPMAAYASELIESHYYKAEIDGDEEKADQMMKERKKENPSRIPCLLSASKKYPGKFLLSYLPRERCVHEYVSVSPNGVRYRGQTFARVGELFNWFRKHFRDPRPVIAPNPTPVYAPSGPTVNATPIAATMNSFCSLPQAIITDGAEEMEDGLYHHTLSMVSGETPGQYSLRTPFSIAASQHGSRPNTPYTPMARTPCVTPMSGYRGQQAPGYGHATPGNYGGSEFPHFRAPGTTGVQGFPALSPRSIGGSPLWKRTPNINFTSHGERWSRGRGERDGGGRGRGGRGNRGGGRGASNYRSNSSRGNWSNSSRSGNNTPLWDESESWDNAEPAVHPSTGKSSEQRASVVPPVGNRSPLWDESESWDDPEPAVPPSTRKSTEQRPPIVAPVGNRSPLWDESESWDDPKPVVPPPTKKAVEQPPPIIAPVRRRSPLWDESESWDNPEPAVPPSSRKSVEQRPPIIAPVGNRSPLWDESESWDEPEPAAPGTKKHPTGRNEPRITPGSQNAPPLGSRTPLYDPSESWDSDGDANILPEAGKEFGSAVLRQRAPLSLKSSYPLPPTNHVPRSNVRPAGSKTPIHASSINWTGGNRRPSGRSRGRRGRPAYDNFRGRSSRNPTPPRTSPTPARSHGERSPLYDESESWD